MSYLHALANAYLVKACYYTKPDNARRDEQGKDLETKVRMDDRFFNSEYFHRKLSTKCDIDNGDTV